jgi:hypothetical protein
MIGRQGLHISRRDLKDSFKEFGVPVNDEQIDDIFTKNDGYAEQLFTQLGARDVHSFDVSPYEEATHLCDMNKEVPADVKDQYTTVLDGGSLEHVFNFAVAIKNCMEMVKVGGHYLGITPSNNLMGHGFYQLSPEIYFSVFKPENGFQVISLIAFEEVRGATWYSVKSPKEVKGRVTLANNLPVYLLVVAKRLTKTNIFETTTQQSDYVLAWDHDETASDRVQRIARPSSKHLPPLEWIKRSTPVSLRRLIKRFIQCSRSGFDSRFFQPMDPTASVRPPDNSPRQTP